MEELADLMKVTNYIVIFSMKKQRSSFCKARMDSEIANLASIECLL